MRRIFSSTHSAEAESTRNFWRRWLAALGLTATCFLAIAYSVKAGGPISRMDQWEVLRSAPDTGWLTKAVGAVSWLHSTVGLVALSTALAFWLVWRRKAKRDAASVVLAMLGGGALNSALKAWIARPRPDGADLLPNAYGYGFPSGHVMLATILYGLALMYAPSSPRSPVVRPALSLLVLAVIAVVATERVWSGAHYPSDTLAAVFAGVTWLSVVALANRLAAPSHPCT